LKTSKLIFVIVIICLFKINICGHDIHIDVINEVNNILYTDFYYYLHYLSSDELKALDTGEGYAMAIYYVAKEFNKNGLHDFGDSWRYF